MNLARIVTGIIDSIDKGRAFHADIGGVGIATETDGMTGAIRGLFDDGITAWARIRGCTAVGPENYHSVVTFS